MTDKSRKRFFLLPGIAMMSLHVCAQIDAHSDSIAAEQSLNPIVITGTGTFHRASNSPVSVQVITQKQLHDSGVSSLAEALTKLTSGVTTMTNGMGTFFNMNGLSDDYVLILENGQRVSGDDRMQRINISKVKRIEILGGSAGSLYGSEAMAGVINIITDDSKNDVSLQSFTQLASKGRFDQQIGADIRQGKLTSNTAYAHKEADNWQVAQYDEFIVDGETVRRPTGRPMSQGFHSDNISQKLQWTFSDAWSVYLRGNYYNHETDRPQNAQYTSKVTKKNDAYTYTTKQAYTYDIHHQSYLYGGGARWNPNKQVHVYADIYSDNAVSKYDYWATADEYSYELTRKRTHYWNESLRGIFRLASWNKLSAGIEGIQETLSSQSDNIDYEQTNTYNAFAQEELSLAPWLEAVVGARYTYNGNFGSHFTPSASLFAHIGALRLRASYAGGYRTPSLSQLYATDQAKTTARYTLSNASLKPEKNHFWTLNMEYAGKWYSVGVTGFWNKVSDMINYRIMTQAEIDASPELTALYNEGWTTIRQRSNIDAAEIKGITANVRLVFPYGLSLTGQWTWTQSDSETKTLNTKTQEYETTTAPVDKSVKNVGSVSLTWDRTWRNYHLNAQLQGRMQSRRYSSTYGYCQGYGQWDFTTHHSFNLSGYTLEPGIGIDNIFNKRDTSAWNSNFFSVNPGRSLVVSLRVRMN